MKSIILIILSVLVSPILFAQCEIHNKVQADGSMLYFLEPATFYTTKSKSLKIGIITDKENYFIALQPSPFPSKEVGKKIKEDLVIELADANKYKLEHFDTRYIKHDSVMQVLYLIDKKDLKAFSSFEAVSADINMEGTEFIRNYAFKLHKKAIMQQLNCFLKDEE
jgi:outer membrane protein assembly factor BamD (BamD/ComL family)